MNKSPFETTTLQSCLRHTRKGDAVLFIEDGVFGALKGTDASGDVWGRRVEVSFYVLGPDAEARGLTEGRMIDGITIIDYEGFVDLVAKHNVTQAWL